MSEYLDEAVWRENYRDLVGGVQMISANRLPDQLPSPRKRTAENPCLD